MISTGTFGVCSIATEGCAFSAGCQSQPWFKGVWGTCPGDQNLILAILAAESMIVHFHLICRFPTNSRRYRVKQNKQTKTIKAGGFQNIKQVRWVGTVDHLSQALTTGSSQCAIFSMLDMLLFVLSYVTNLDDPGEARMIFEDEFFRSWWLELLTVKTTLVEMSFLILKSKSKTKSPMISNIFLIVKSQLLMVSSSFLLLKSPCSMVNSSFLMVQLPTFDAPKVARGTKVSWMLGYSFPTAETWWTTRSRAEFHGRFSRSEPPMTKT